ncbi:hypothetical protein FTUN_1784 [Frigoriglobus tundricola]|uniref:Chromosome partition protein smc n=2 Tax=Frigoriglobus tundricola TaxID=2774151 RepID=A0A6M5YL09_9BACT|nr:hypothetical protein FTUN_1784 [Frigoriglobus tundricola]
MFWVKKATAAAFALSAVFALGIGAGLSTRTEYAGAGAQEKGVPATGTGLKAQPAVVSEIAALEDAIGKKTAFHKALTDEMRDALKKTAALKAAVELKKAEYLNLKAATVASEKAEMQARALRHAIVEYEEASQKHDQLRKVTDQAWADLKELKAKLDNLKGAIPAPQIAPPQDIDSDPEVVAQHQKMVRARTEYEFRLNATDDKNSPGILRLEAAYEVQKKKYEELKKEKIAAHELNTITEQLARATREKERLLREVSAATAEEQALHAYRDRLAERAKRAKQIANLEEDVRKLEQKYTSAHDGFRAAQKRYELTKNVLGANPKEVLDDQIIVARFRDELEAAETQLKGARDRLAKLKGIAVQAPAECIELTVGGQAGEFEFVIREVPVDQTVTKRGTGPVTTRDPVMLAKLLARAKSDPNGPQQVVIIAQPQTSFTTGPGAALKACGAAGYKTVTFTGYVFGGGEAVQLKLDQKGEVPGYKRYDAAEVKPADLLKEIQDGMRRF